MPQEIPPPARLAEIYGTHRKSIHRWRDRGFPLGDPVALLAALSQQRNPGSLIRRLSRPETLAAATAAIRGLSAQGRTGGNRAEAIVSFGGQAPEHKDPFDH